MSDTLKFISDDLQIIALCFMGTVYFLRIRWLLKYRPSRDRQAPTGMGEARPQKAIFYSLSNIANPWAMESTRTDLFFYLQFVIFHLGVASGIALSFIIPYAPRMLENSFWVPLFQGVMGAALLTGLYRLYRRLRNPVIRKISSPDDYFSLILLSIWLFFAIWAAPNQPEKGEGPLLIYFLLTAFFLIYVPFSKISHYLYYPFNRYYFGRTMGHRGVYPLNRGWETKRSKAEPGQA